MKRFLIAISCILLAVSACKSSSGNDSTTPEETPAHVVKATDYLPHMGAVSYILTTVQEVSGLCLAPDGDGLLAYWDVSFIDNAEGLYVDHDHNCIWVGDDTTSRIYKILFEGL